MWLPTAWYWNGSNYWAQVLNKTDQMPGHMTVNKTDQITCHMPVNKTDHMNGHIPCNETEQLLVKCLLTKLKWSHDTIGIEVNKESSNNELKSLKDKVESMGTARDQNVSSLPMTEKKCTLCDKKFSLNSELEKHLDDKHSIEKENVGNLCGKTFHLQCNWKSTRKFMTEKRLWSISISSTT